MNKTEKLIVKKAVEAKEISDRLLEDKRATDTHKIRRQAIWFAFSELVRDLELEEEYHKLL